MSAYHSSNPYGNGPAPPRPARPSRYIEQGEETQLMEDGIRPVSGRSSPRPAHGTPVYTSAAADRYTPYTEYQPEQIGQTYTAEYKTVDLNSYSIPGSSEAEQTPIHFIAEEKQGIRSRYRGFFKALSAILLFLFVGFLLAIPLLFTYDAVGSQEHDSQQRQIKNLVFYIFIMLEMVWCMTALCYIFAMLLPYVFRIVAHYINPAHERYWRVFIMLRSAIIILGAVVSGYICSAIWIEYNPDISVWNNADGGDPTDPQAKLDAQEQIDDITDTIDLILLYFVLWAGAFLFEKILIAYLTIHYHFRSHHHEILQSKKLVDALVALYDYSYTVYPMGHPHFTSEDWVIHRGLDSKSGKRTFGRTTIGVTDMLTGSFSQAFGVVFGSESSSHWFSPRSTYAIIGRALQHPAASAALAKRIWVALVSDQRDSLTVEDLQEALGPNRAAKAIGYFQALDENENGDIRLSELVPSIVEGGKRRRDIYKSMADANHVVNTWDWLLCGVLAILMGGLVLVSQVPQLMAIKDVIGLGLVGISFVGGRTLNEFVQGAIFTLLDHPYDVGDVVEIHNLAESVKNLLVVKRISLLYSVFEEVGSGKYVQFANMRSKLKKITNLTRSGKNREAVSFAVDFNTTFKDLELLKEELKTFITAPENSRDYYPDLGLRINSLGDLNKLEIRVSFRHKSNWSNEAVRAARSSRFQCAIVAAVRKVPINKPGGGKTDLGDEGKPSYTVMITDTEAAAKRDADKEKQLKKRMDHVEPESKILEVDFSTLTADELREAEEKKVKAEEKAAKDARQKEEEAQAVIRMMGLKDIGVVSRGTTTMTGAELGTSQSPFLFITGNETGRRRGRTFAG